MNKSPFEVFRRNLKPLMVFLTLLALFSFVVLPALDGYLRRGAGVGSSNPVVASFDGVEVQRSRVEIFTRNHQQVVQFLVTLAEETIRRGGVPRTAGFEYDTQNQQVRQLGIESRPDERVTIKTLQWAAEAKKSGFELDDATIRRWLQDFTDGTMSDAEINGLLLQSSGNQLGQFHLYEQLRYHLLTQLYLRAGLAGIARGSMPILTPAEQYQNFLKLNRQATVDAYGVIVSEFLDQTNANPDAAEIERVYELGKDRFPNQLPREPGFRRPYVASFEFVAANLSTFIDREVGSFSDEELRAEYEKRLAGGDFVMPTEPAEMPPAEMETTDEPAAEPANEPAEPADDAAEGEPAPEDPAETPPTDDGAGAEDKSSALSSNQAVKLVAFQEDQNAAGSADATDAPTEDADATVTETTTDPPTTDPPTTDPPTTDPPTTDPPTTDPPATDPPAPPTDPPATAADVSATPSDDSAAVGDATPGSETTAPATTQQQSFEDVKNQIADDLARPIARRKQRQAVEQVANKMREYFNRRAYYESVRAQGASGDTAPPKRPDLKALAQELGLQYVAIDDKNAANIREAPVASSTDLAASISQRPADFVALMYGEQTAEAFLPGQSLFSPVLTQDLQTSKVYASWKTSEHDDFVPTLEQAREEVIETIRFDEARELARQRAEEIAAKTASQPLTDVVDESKRDNLQTSVGPFSWMNAFGFIQATIGNVPELDDVGEQFMRAVFTTEVGQSAVAPNQPATVFYVVKPTGFQPSVDELRRRFRQPQERMMALFMGTDEMQEIQRGFIAGIDKRTDFQLDLPVE